MVALNILATPFLGVGLVLKKIAVNNDPSAAKINEKVETYQQRRSVAKEDMKELSAKEKELSHCVKEITKIERQQNRGVQNIQLAAKRVELLEKKGTLETQVQAKKERVNLIVNGTAEEVVGLFRRELAPIKESLAAEREELKELKGKAQKMSPEDSELPQVAKKLQALQMAVRQDEMAEFCINRKIEKIEKYNK